MPFEFIAPLAFGQWWSQLTQTQSIAVVLWGGFAPLTLSLMVLMRTRWGQAKPLSKCIVLSVFAHVLLVGYAYTTKLIFDYPAARSREEVMQVVFEPRADDLPVSEADDSEQQPQPWNNLAADESVGPRASDLHRQAVGEPRRPNREPPPLLAQDDDRGAFSLADTGEAEITRPLAEQPQNGMPAIAPAVLGAVAMETPPAKTNAESLVAPAPPSPSRRIAGPTDQPAPESDNVPQPPGDLLAVDSQIQRMLDNDVTAETADAVVGRDDQLKEAPNELAATNPTSNVNSGKPGPDDEQTRILAPTPASLVARHTLSPSGQRRQIPRRLGDGGEIPKLYRLRVGATRALQARHYGATQETEQAVDAALAWLAANQSEDGRWNPRIFAGGRELQVLNHNRDGAGANADTGISGLALLALLARGHTHLEGRYRGNVERGLAFLQREQGEEGELYGDAKLYAKMYCHGMAMLALSEAYAMTGDVRLRPAVNRAVRFTVAAQDPRGGGWRYLPGDEGDMSQFGWQVMALKSAELAGAPIPQKTREGMRRFIASVSSGREGGLASYRRIERPTPAMTAEAVACRTLLGIPQSEAMISESSWFILRDRPGGGRPNLYGWYYSTISLFQVQGDAWRQWNAAMQTELIGSQRRDGDASGSWDPDSLWGGYGGRVYSTAMAALCLEVYYRYLPILK